MTDARGDREGVGDAGEARGSREASEAYEVREAGDAREVREASEAREVREASQAREVREASEAREVREASEASEAPETRAPVEPPHAASPHEQPPHAGNGTVKHGLDDQSPEGFDSDELALRRMLHQAVQGIEPRDGTLEHLKRAVPARRARKRQAAVGMAAAALFIGTAVPALVHVSTATGSDANPSIAGNSSEAQGGTGTNIPDGRETTAGSGSAAAPGQGKDGGKDADQGKGSGAGGAADPAATSGAGGVPECTADQLGGATAESSGPDASGIVHGTFHIVNVSAADCTVTGPGTVTPLAAGAADPARITLAEHTAGDAVSGLPDPAMSMSRLVLAPGAGYDVRFAWVPSETCPTDSSGTAGTGGTAGSGGDGGATAGGGDSGGSSTPSTDPSPSPDASGDGSAGVSAGTASGTTPQLVADGGTAEGSVVVSYTPVTGSPTASTTVSDACAGTVYRTGLLAR
ncbi:hypothetical protein [Streptomyces sp. NPDC057386]|uniref:hypothetical protein n=1 Tax=unclassified Streptomyces TaxID=2593676 RepID=UPI003630179F